jgi:hypothetical protein
MPFKLFRDPQQTTAKCPHCHEDILNQEPTLFFGERPFHRDCWIRGIMGPAESYGREMPIDRDAAASTLEKRRRA